MKPFFVILSVLLFLFGCVNNSKNEENNVFIIKYDEAQEITDSI